MARDADSMALDHLDRLQGKTGPAVRRSRRAPGCSFLWCRVSVAKLEPGRDVEPAYRAPQDEADAVLAGITPRAPADVRCFIERQANLAAEIAAMYRGVQRRQARARPPGTVYALRCQLLEDWDEGDPAIVVDDDLVYLHPRELAFAIASRTMPHRMLLPPTPNIPAERRFARTPREPAWTVPHFRTAESIFQQICDDCARHRERSQRASAIWCLDHPQNTRFRVPRDLAREIVARIEYASPPRAQP